MELAKNTLRATVQIGYDGQVFKTYRGPKAAERFANEAKVLKYLEDQGCPFVPKLLNSDAQQLQITISYCGNRVEHLDDARAEELFTELESYGVHHDDEAVRNVTYRQMDGRFCVIDFEFATILANHVPRHNHNLQTSLTRGLRWSGHTDKGKVREKNEDSFRGIRFDRREVHYLGKVGEAQVRNADYVFAVSDGMGGAMAGEYASWITMEKIIRLLPQSFKLSGCGLEAGCTDVLGELFTQIHQTLAWMGGSYDECLDMQATLSVCWFAPGWMYFGHIGDSRIYYLPVGESTLRQLSSDDTHAGWLFRNGQLNEWEAKNHPQKNILQKSLGADNQFVEPQVGAVSCQVGDRFVLCTDGLVGGLFDQQIVELLRAPSTETNFFDSAQTLVNASLNNSGQDNTTAVVIEVI